MLYQQGDVLIETITELPSHANPISPSTGRVILAQGEATGHAHAVIEPVDLYEVGDRLYCRAEGPFTVVHEEHRAIKVPAGLYRIRKVQEYDHFAEEARWVED